MFPCKWLAITGVVVVADQLCSKKQIGLCASDDERAWEKRVVIENVRQFFWAFLLMLSHLK